MEEGFDVAQVCLNGHVTNDASRESPQYNQDYCDKCGEKTITECPGCGTPIRGYYWGSLSMGKYQAPAHCYKCGEPFPWTERRINAARELAVELGGLAPSDAQDFDADLKQLVSDTPNTQVAARRVKKVLAKVGHEAASGIRDIVIDIASETAKKIIWPQG